MRPCALGVMCPRSRPAMCCRLSPLHGWPALAREREIKPTELRSAPAACRCSRGGPTSQPPCSLFAWLISHQSAVLFSQNKPATSNKPTVLFSQNKPAPAISHQPTEQTVDSFRWVQRQTRKRILKPRQTLCTIELRGGEFCRLTLICSTFEIWSLFSSWLGKVARYSVTCCLVLFEGVTCVCSC
jgi:hypothetical protein